MDKTTFQEINSHFNKAYSLFLSSVRILEVNSLDLKLMVSFLAIFVAGKTNVL